MSSRATEAIVRAALDEALGDRRLGGVGAAEPLLCRGVVTSIELVRVLVDLERRFGVAIPPGTAAQMSVASIVRALGGDAATEPRPTEPTAVARGFARALLRPRIFVASLVLCLFVLDRAAAFLVQGPLAAAHRAFVEDGRRFYAYSGSFSQDSFRAALRDHEISAPTPVGSSPDELRVAVFGDCGTAGSFVPAGDAIPARVEAALRAQGTPAKVYNLAWYGRVLPKDFMLLELVWDRPLDLVVFTISDDHLRKSENDAAIARYRHVTFNWELFERFMDRVPAREQAPFREVLARLRFADVVHQGPLRRWAYESFAILPYQPFLRYLATVRWLPEPFVSPMRGEMTAGGRQRVALAESPPPLPPALTSADLDRGEIRMLRSAIRLLQRRGVQVLLYAEPVAPRAWQTPRALTAARVAERLAAETGSLFVDQSWALDAGDFTDALSHFTLEANRRIGEALARAIQRRD